MKLHHVPEPMTTEEQYLVAQIKALQQAYHEAAKPYVDRLVTINACKQPRYFVELEAGDTPDSLKRFMQ